MRQEDALDALRGLGFGTSRQVAEAHYGRNVTKNEVIDTNMKLNRLLKWGNVRKVGLTEKIRGNRAVIWEVVE